MSSIEFHPVDQSICGSLWNGRSRSNKAKEGFILHSSQLTRTTYFFRQWQHSLQPRYNKDLTEVDGCKLSSQCKMQKILNVNFWKWLKFKVTFIKGSTTTLSDRQKTVRLSFKALCEMQQGCRIGNGHLPLFWEKIDFR